jgi:hypothetical protein
MSELSRLPGLARLVVTVFDLCAKRQDKRQERYGHKITATTWIVALFARHENRHAAIQKLLHPDPPKLETFAPQAMVQEFQFILELVSGPSLPEEFLSIKTPITDTGALWLYTAQIRHEAAVRNMLSEATRNGVGGYKGKPMGPLYICKIIPGPIIIE